MFLRRMAVDPEGCCQAKSGPISPGADVRFGSKADIEVLATDVRFTPKSGHWNLVA